eukprot:scaffold48434_cov343-Isochrysis_galbana.AAC.2
MKVWGRVVWRRAQPRRGAAPSSKRNPRPRAGNGGALVESMRAWRRVAKCNLSVPPTGKAHGGVRCALSPIAYCYIAARAVDGRGPLT